MTITIKTVRKSFWRAGILMDSFSGEGFSGHCNSSGYRNRMTCVTVTIKGLGKRGFVLASMPLEWSPKVGDTITIHESQL